MTPCKSTVVKLDDAINCIETCCQSLLVPVSGVVKVAESGVRDGDDARRLRDAGYDAILVGETLVTSPDPASTIQLLKGD